MVDTLIAQFFAMHSVLIIFQGILLFLELKFLQRCSSWIFGLIFIFSIGLSLILTHYRLERHRYSSIFDNLKTNEFDMIAKEFLKISVIIAIIIFISIVAFFYFPDIPDLWACLADFSIFLIVFLNWNTKDFIILTVSTFIGFFKNPFSCREKQKTNLASIIAADVWTSFAKPISRLFSNSHGLSALILL
jgi:hypothetical protein